MNRRKKVSRLKWKAGISKGRFIMSTTLATKQDISELDKELAVLKVRLATVEKILWAVALGVLALVSKAFVPMVVT